MDIFQFAKEKEEFSIDYYQELADKTDNQGLKTIFKMLADEERSHLKYVDQMEQNQSVKVADSKILDNAKQIFTSMRKNASNINFKMDEAAVYKKAGIYETESENFYRKCANEVINASQKEIFSKLADMEHQHYILMENIYNFLEAPKYFLENAEICSFDDYPPNKL